jgi:hypothetical protein
MKSFQDYINENADLRYDNPGGDWLKHKQEDAEASYGRFKGITGSTTAYTRNRTIKLKVDAIKHLPGARGEEAYRDHSSKMADLEKDVGHPHNFNSEKYPIMLAVNHRGEAFVQEGNHRLAYAAKHKIPHIHAEVRYYNGGEEKDGPLHPSKLKAIAA